MTSPRECRCLLLARAVLAGTPEHVAAHVADSDRNAQAKAGDAMTRAPSGRVRAVRAYAAGCSAAFTRRCAAELRQRWQLHVIIALVLAAC